MRVPGLEDGAYVVSAYDTVDGPVLETWRADSLSGEMTFTPPAFVADRAFAIRKP